MDIEESGKQIGEKLFLLLNEEQKNALMQYILEQGVCHGTVFNSCHTSSASKKNPLTEIQEGELYLSLNGTINLQMYWKTEANEIVGSTIL